MVINDELNFINKLIKLNAYSCDGNGKIVTKKFSKEAEVATRHNNGGEQGRLIDKWHNGLMFILD